MERLLGAIVRANNGMIRSVGAADPNPRPLAGLRWHDELRAATPGIRREWLAFRDAGGRLPRIEDLLGEHQGNSEVWAAGLLVSRGRPVEPIARHFPVTTAALGRVPGLRSALWSVLAPGAELPAHRGPNAGVLRYHLGVVCRPGAVLEVEGRPTPYVEGEGILFDDTAEHAARNEAPSERVTLFCEILRPLPAGAGLTNSVVQRLLGLAPRYRGAARRAEAWDRSLNRAGAVR
ncbi:MAG: aspartyl/asparaginyl beta-hydroxylase domain-containing protein [Microthrixaceae bacterium]